MARAWALIIGLAIAVVTLDVAELRGRERPLLDRRDCQASPSAHTRELDGSQRGDALYRFVYGTLLGFSATPRAGFPHVGVGAVCTLGWKDPVAAIKIGPHVFLVTFEGPRVDSVEAATP